MTKEHIVAFRLDDEKLKLLDERVKLKGFATRTDYILSLVQADAQVPARTHKRRKKHHKRKAKFRQGVLQGFEPLPKITSD